MYGPRKPGRVRAAEQGLSKNGARFAIENKKLFRRANGQPLAFGGKTHIEAFAMIEARRPFPRIRDDIPRIEKTVGVQENEQIARRRENNPARGKYACRHDPGK